MQPHPSLTEEELSARAAKIKVLLMDVDGVLTDCKIYLFFGVKGEMVETKGFNPQDGIALTWARWKGIEMGIISGRASHATTQLAREAGMRWVMQGDIEKIPLFERIMSEANVTKDEVAYVGDDLTDVVIFRRVGLSFAVANARPEVKACANAVTSTEGGSGAVREIVELLLKSRGDWDDLLRRYEVIA